MAIAMYEALGKSMSSYRKNLQDIDKGSIKSDLVSYEAAQDRAFTDSLATTIANTAGIIGEKLQISKDIQTGKEAMGVYESSEEYQPLGRFGKFLGLDEKERSVYKSRETGKILSSEQLQNIGIMDRLGLSNKYSDYKLKDAPKRPVDLSTEKESATSPSDMKIDNSLLDNYETSLSDMSLQERQFGYRSKSERFDIEPTTSNVGGTEMANVSMRVTSPKYNPFQAKPKQTSVFDMIKNIANVRRKIGI